MYFGVSIIQDYRQNNNNPSVCNNIVLCSTVPMIKMNMMIVDTTMIKWLQHEVYKLCATVTFMDSFDVDINFSIIKHHFTLYGYQYWKANKNQKRLLNDK